MCTHLSMIKPVMSRHVMELLAAIFFASLLLTRFNGWGIGTSYALLSGTVLAWLQLTSSRRWVGYFLASLLPVVAWILYRDVSTGTGWSAGERAFKAAILLLGMIAVCKLPLQSWLRSMAWAIGITGLLLILFIGPAQALSAVLSPFEIAKFGLQTSMNRNGLALPMGLMLVTAFAGALNSSSRIFFIAWVIAVAALGLLVMANGSRGAIAALMASLLLMLFLRAPKLAWQAAGLIVVTAVVSYWLHPDYWLHSGTLMSERDVIWRGVLQHLPEHIGLGAGGGYFREVVGPALPQPFSIAHNIYLDWLLAYGLVGTALLLMSGECLRRMLQYQQLEPQHVWILGSGAYLLTMGLFDRHPLDPVMFLGLLLIPHLGVILTKALKASSIIFMTTSRAREATVKF